MSNQPATKLNRSPVSSGDDGLVLSPEEMDNECLSPPRPGVATLEKAGKIVEIAEKWTNRAGWQSFVNHIRKSLEAEAFLLVELVAGEGPKRIVAQSFSNACRIQYPAVGIPDYLLSNELLSQAIPKKDRFDETMDKTFPAFRHLHGRILCDCAGKPIAALAFGFQDEDLANDPSFDTIVGLVASLVATQVDFEREVASREEIESMLRQSQKLTSVGRLATGIAHDFNNLLTVIQGHTSLLERIVEEAGNEKAMESLGLIRSASLQAVELSKQLLLFSRQQCVNLETCDLNQVVSEFVKMMRRMVEETINLDIKLGVGLDQIKADRSMLGQVMMNLILNARDAMSDGGRITIETSVRSLSPAEDRIGPGDYACLSIRDNGSGIPPEKLPKIFDPFFTTKEREKGTGLGLSNVAAIIREHGGQVDVSSEVDAGTTFEIFLPMVVGRIATPAPEKYDTKDEKSLKGITILLVEDENGVRKLVRKLLEMLGSEVIEAKSGRQALDLWPEISEKVSLVVTDIVMPEGVSGWDLARELHSTRPKLGILLTSGYNERPEDQGLGDEEQIAFLQKPYEAKTLKHTLNQLLIGEAVKPNA